MATDPGRSGGTVYATVSNTVEGNLLWVRVPPSAPAPLSWDRMASRRFIGYPTDALIAVLPGAESAARAAGALRAAGVPDRDITVLRGDEGADRLDGTGAVNGALARLRPPPCAPPGSRIATSRSCAARKVRTGSTARVR